MVTVRDAYVDVMRKIMVDDRNKTDTEKSELKALFVPGSSEFHLLTARL